MWPNTKREIGRVGGARNAVELEHAAEATGEQHVGAEAGVGVGPGRRAVGVGVVGVDGRRRPVGVAVDVDRAAGDDLGGRRSDDVVADPEGDVDRGPDAGQRLGA